MAQKNRRIKLDVYVRVLCLIQLSLSGRKASFCCCQTQLNGTLLKFARKANGRQNMHGKKFYNKIICLAPENRQVFSHTFHLCEMPLWGIPHAKQADKQPDNFVAATNVWQICRQESRFVGLNVEATATIKGALSVRNAKMRRINICI